MNILRVIAAHWLLSIYFVGCAAADFFPNFGSPNFRYTGSDPTHAVWNFGWPLAAFIYDSRYGLHFGPFMLVILSFQIFVFVLILAILAAIKFSRQKYNRRAEQAAASNGDKRPS